MKKLSLLALSVLLLAACGSEEAGSTGSAGEEKEQAPAEQTETATDVAEETEEAAESEENKESEYGKRSNPVPVGQSQLVDIAINDSDFNSYEAKAEITITSVQRGQEVLEFVQGNNEFNETPPEGYEYMMLDVSAELTEAETEDYAWFMDGMFFNFIGGDGSPYEWTSVVVEPDLSGEIYVGGSMEGKVVNMVKKDDPILIVFEDGNWDNVFFATE